MKKSRSSHPPRECKKLDNNGSDYFNAIRVVNLDKGIYEDTIFELFKCDYMTDIYKGTTIIVFFNKRMYNRAKTFKGATIDGRPVYLLKP